MVFNFRVSALIILWIISANKSFSQSEAERTKFKGFGHQEYSVVRKDSVDSYFSIGEHDFFITGILSPKISFLGEFVVRYNAASSTGFLPSIERSFIKFNYVNNHSVIAGKVHTPVNYWNDVYHHGRLLFPVIDRPLAFSYLIPLHTLGLQFQGQNLGSSGFGYDLMFGNGISSSDVFQGGFNPALTAALHVKPVQDMQLRASYFYNYMNQNRTGVHIGHMLTSGVNAAKLYKGPVQLHLFSTSFAWFGRRAEFLSETSLNLSNTDTLGTARGISTFTYAGYRINDKNIPFFLIDYIKIGKEDLHVYPTEMLKVALGYRYEFNYLINIKAQLEHTWMKHGDNNLINDHFGNLGLRLQLAYGF
jgi:hypothetical protein